MHICYPSHAPKGGGFSSYHSQDATAQYLRHYENYLLLHYIARHCPDYVARRQALGELPTCEKKLARWMAHQNFNLQEATRGVLELKRKAIK